ncbi:MAG: hypothetical protein US83_C0004G0052 [Candidatus Falkowbacteria bacterium GW2011_GWC2_38_22]|uniref:Uncharacterized protein n=1 Tax=Candidatus Falkowbacteria bacterium GW2011_GWE1_38_31 TaxID=1618638 RepID=A0A0G0K546_9BACT|nr:MAG: hypothetical protein US73_C0002G0065 [Candidatus Falkowbacteria bacterium GW2011_GWF2_38_1205]KKQ61668.1 MAG: hypothetical protein US83_C0004G0052 [Candidatus Falkowbacteria bacterium GW2011_GWC2_38_22]KKQ63717.1 MAG: hypothetical protein US84_C0004G0065 [Candidatus Falkowbacteria bacterium GW2011_GWF1_38_22]KKQ65867.1 MAG: hypothetical protein US87_C0004G0052 [Candidatus Falkowbacteria bacterium GW2011_GWE2_38_254]KKQ70580.1 MAG: hypothetical protein US91_C0004G0065 [Candidatus Falkowb
MFHYLVFGKMGKIISVTHVHNNEEIKSLAKDRISVRPEDFFMNYIDCKKSDDRTPEAELAYVEKLITPHYNYWGLFGPYGDVISVVKSREGDNYDYYYIALMGNIEYPLPVLTVDFVPFFEDINLKTFFVGIIRKDDPGKGKPAFIGGHRDVVGYKFQTPFEALLHESLDEAAIKILPVTTEDMDNPNLMNKRVVIQLGGRIINTELFSLGEFVTGEDEKIKHLNKKRVNETTAITAVIPYEGVLSEELLKKMFQAGSDADDIFVWDTEKGVPKFGIDHHKEIYKKAFNFFS